MEITTGNQNKEPTIEEPVIKEEPKQDEVKQDEPELTRQMPSSFTREFTIDKANATDDRTVDMSFSSETPYQRYYWQFDSYADEILLHDARSMDMSRLNNKANVLYNHNRDDYIGVVEQAYIKDKKGRAKVRFASEGRGAEVYNAIKEGILTNVSVGYSVKSYEFVPSTSKGSEDAKMLIKDWMPFEISIVTVPADTSVGVGRSFETNNKITEVIMNKSTEDSSGTVEAPEVMTREQEVQEIQALGKHYELKSEMVEDYVKAGISLENFRKEVVLDHLREKYKQPEKIADDLTDKEREVYDIARAITAIHMEKSSGGAKKFRDVAPFEYEVNESLKAKRSIRARVHGDIILPNNLVKGSDLNKQVQARTMLTSTNTAIMPQDYLASNLVDILLTPIREHGFTTMTDLVGQTVIPRFLSGTTGAWIAENSTTTATDLTFDTVSMQLHTAQAKNLMSIQSEMVTPFSIRQMVTDNLVYSLQYLLYNTIFNGTGIAPAPKGLLNYTGLGAIASSGTKVVNSNFATTKKEIVYSDLVGAETAVKLQKVLTPNLKFIGNPKMTGQLKTTLDDSNTQSVRLLRDGMLDGYAYQESFVVPDGTLIFGDFSKMCIGLWGTPEIFVDPIDDNGLIKTKVFMFADLVNLLPQAFAVITNTTSA